MDSQTQPVSREEIRSIVVTALLSTKVRPDTESALADDEMAIGDAGLGINSLNLMQALVKVENALGIVFDDRAVADAALHSVGAVVDLAERVAAGQVR
jgi:acyl carrier protein